ncbi:SPX domain-containing protein 1 [Camellia lanceoleosa]|uniref:SPX domain-containing protein 1 n=1 Tax=Camellia lanceoleosa TaxID=1840588 RepID=A0ACC0I4P2_9ERIC|nr:SPX domain-containing protein 1 [Camellia lanceoleosa]
MKFGKSLRSEIAETLPEWKGKFISYKELKKQLKLIAHEEEEGMIDFIQLLDNELEKVNTFFIDKEEEYIIRIRELKDRVANMKSSEDMTQVKLDILEFHGEMVLLLHYSVINFAGLLKIVKKHNKKTGTVIWLPFMPKVLQQPFFTSDLICELLKECEVMLNQLFL